MADIKIKAASRAEKSTQKVLNEIRGARQIPGVIYGGKGGNVKVAVSERELLSALKEGGHNAIIHLKHEKGEDTVIVKDLQRNVVTNIPMHVDFQRIDLKKEIEVMVSIEIIGEAPGVKLNGGVLENVTREIEVQALPDKVPQHIDVDVSALDIGDGIHVKDIAAPAGVKITEDPEKIICHVVQATKEDEVVAPAEGEVAEGAEPEVIAKGKKDEEGAEGEGDAKGAAKPEAKGDAKGGGKK